MEISTLIITNVLGQGTFCRTRNTMSTGLLTQFEDNDGRKLPLKILLAEVYNSFLETSKISHNFFVLVR